MSRRRTLKRYTDLYRNPKTLFPPTAASSGVSVTLFPNGHNEIWLQTDDGLGVRIIAGNGPHGLGVRVSKFVGTPNVTVLDAGVIREETEVELCQYRPTPEAIAFRRWYTHTETEADIQLLGEAYRRQK